MADNQAASAALDGMLRALDRIKDVARTGAPEVAADLEELHREQLAAGTAPDGTAWAPKKDGGRPLVNAASAVRVNVAGTTIVFTLSGVEVYHNYGAGLPKRQILPVTLPASWAARIREKLGARFKQAVKGGA